MLLPQTIEQFRQAGIERSYYAGEPIFLSNEPATGMYLILSGEASVTKRELDGSTTEIARVRSGETMGELSLILNKPHSATVVAKTDLTVVLLTRSRLQELKRNNIELALRLYEALADTLARHLYERPL